MEKNENNENNELSTATMNSKEIFEEQILHKVISDKQFFSSAVPYLKPKYFSEAGNAILFREIHNFYSETGSKPNIKDVLLLIKDIPSNEKAVATESIKKIIKSDVDVDGELLIRKTEDFIKKSLHVESLIMGSEGMGEGNENKLATSFQIAEEAQKVSLDENFGIKYEDINPRIDYYQNQEVGALPGIPSFDNMLGKGIPTKTLSFFLAPPGIGKSAALVAWAAQMARQGKDVVLISLEMREEEYWKRLDANLLGIDIYELERMDPVAIREKHKQMHPGLGRIIVKEFGSYDLTAMKLTSYLEKLENKHGIKNPELFVDYLQLMSSDRMKDSDNTYNYVKSMTSELRAVAQKRDIRIWSASQLNRSAVGNLEAGQEAVSDSAGISMFADLMIFLLQTKDMKKNGELLVNFEKNRITGKTYSFKIGFNYRLMKFEDRFHEDIEFIPPTEDINKDKIDTGLNLGEGDKVDLVTGDFLEDKPYIHEEALILDEDDLLEGRIGQKDQENLDDLLNF